MIFFFQPKCLKNMKCIDPCISGICAPNAVCTVHNHFPTCTCPNGYSGDPFSACKLNPLRKYKFIRRSMHVLIFQLFELISA